MASNGMDRVKVGQTVKVTWIDSGCHYNRAGVEPKDCRLATVTVYGKLVHCDKERIVVATNVDNVHRSATNDRYEVVWRPSIKKIRPLR